MCNILRWIINEYLNPSKYNFDEVQRKDYTEPELIEDILNMLYINVN